MKGGVPRKEQAGFSAVELMIVVVIVFILGAMAIPGYMRTMRYLRIAGDMRGISGMVGQAKMRAAASFTQARVYADLAANTYRIETWNKPIGAATGSWNLEASTGPQNLSPGVTSGFGSVGTPPPSTQAAIAQAPPCRNDTVTPGTGATIADSACIVFNSRGIPIDNTGAPTSLDALYVTDGESVYGVTVSVTGLIQNWYTPANSTAWKKR